MKIKTKFLHGLRTSLPKVSIGRFLFDTENAKLLKKNFYINDKRDDFYNKAHKDFLWF